MCVFGAFIDRALDPRGEDYCILKGKLVMIGAHGTMRHEGVALCDMQLKPPEVKRPKHLGKLPQLCLDFDLEHKRDASGSGGLHHVDNVLTIWQNNRVAHLWGFTCRGDSQYTHSARD